MRHLSSAALVAIAVLAGCSADVFVDATSPPVEVPPSNPPLLDDPPPPVPGERLCESTGLDGAAPLLTLTAEDGVAIVRADGSMQQVSVGAEEAPGDASAVQITARGSGNWLATAATWTMAGAGSIEVGSVLSLFDASGTMLHRQSTTAYDASIQGISSAGEMLVSRYFYTLQPSDHVVFDADGAMITLGGWQPTNWIAPGVLSGRDDGGYGWRDIHAGSVTRAAHTEGAIHTWHFEDGFISLHGGTPPEFHIDLPDGSEVIVIDDLDRDAATLWIEAINGPYLLLVDNSDESRYRVELPSGAVVPIALEPPSGGPPEEMSYCAPNPSLDSGGRVIFAGGGDHLSFMLNEPVAGGWSTIGDPVGGVETMHGAEKDGTYLLESTVGTFCPGPVGVTGVGVVEGQALQIVRPETGSHHVLADANIWSAAIRDGGGCVVYGDFDGVVVVDLEAGVEHRLADAGWATWWSHDQPGSR